MVRTMHTDIVVTRSGTAYIIRSADNDLFDVTRIDAYGGYTQWDGVDVFVHVRRIIIVHDDQVLMRSTRMTKVIMDATKEQLDEIQEQRSMLFLDAIRMELRSLAEKQETPVI